MGRLLVVESLLLACLLLLAGYVFWETLGLVLGLDGVWHSLIDARVSDRSDLALFILVLFVVCCLPIAIYWVLQFIGMTRTSFWSVTLAALAPQIPAVLSYNQLDWPSFWVDPLFTTGLSPIVVASLLLVSLALLVSLHRIGELRRLKARLAALRLDGSEQEGAMVNELLVLGGLSSSALILTAALLTLGIAFARMKDLLVFLPWTVLTVGGAAILLLASVLSLWLRQTGEE